MEDFDLDCTSPGRQRPAGGRARRVRQGWRACAGNLNWTWPIPVLGHCGPFTGRAEALHPPPVQGQQTRTHRALRIECERRGKPHSRPGQGWSPSAPRGAPSPRQATGLCSPRNAASTRSTLSMPHKTEPKAQHSSAAGTPLSHLSRGWLRRRKEGGPSLVASPSGEPKSLSAAQMCLG